MRKPFFCIYENKEADQLRGDREADQHLFFATQIVQSLYFQNPKFQASDQFQAKLISTFFFATQIVQSLYFQNPKFQASNYLLWLYSPVFVGPVRKPRRPVFSERGSYFVCSNV